MARQITHAPLAISVMFCKERRFAFTQGCLVYRMAGHTRAIKQCSTFFPLLLCLAACTKALSALQCWLAWSDYSSLGELLLASGRR